jgi:hypothetical protein
MAVTEYKELSRSGSIDEQGYRTYRREFLVTTDNPLDGPLTVAAGVPVPFYSVYNLGDGEVDIYARCKKQDATPIPGELYLWKFTCDYDSKPMDFNVGSNGAMTPASDQEPTPQNQQAPNLRPWMIKFGSTQVEEAITTDYSTPSKRIVASNGQPFDGLSVTRSIAQFTVTGWTVAPGFDKVQTYVNTVNDGAFLGFAENTLKCVDYQVQSVFEQNAYFYQRDITIQIAQTDWDIRVLDAGTYQKVSNSKPNEAIKDSTGNPVDSPVPLNGSGIKLEPGNPLVYLLFKGYPKRNFNTIV